jgi:hypothetical protein
MKTTTRSRWAARSARVLLWAAPLYAAALITLAVDASARPDPITEAANLESANLERARLRHLGNMVGLSLMGALIVIPLAVALVRHSRNPRTDWAVEDADPAE